MNTFFLLSQLLEKSLLQLQVLSPLFEHAPSSFRPLLEMPLDSLQEEVSLHDNSKM